MLVKTRPMPPKRVMQKGKKEQDAKPVLPDEDMFAFDNEDGYSTPLITFDNNTFEVNEDAVRVLDKLEPPLALVSVAGMYRTGKSFLLNRVILAKQNAFTVGPTTRACTKGIWMWSEPVRATDSQGRTVNLIIVDTEGIGAPTADATHDTRIFALGLLLSTYFIYNSVGSIDEQALSNLSLVTNLSKQIKQRASDTVAVHYPSFLWVVRDFALQLQDQDGAHISPREYLEDALKDCDSSNPAAESKNRVRSCLREFFPERHCFTMVRPCTAENQLQNLDYLPNKSLRPEFVQQAAELRERIFAEAANRPNTVNGVELSGSMVGMLCREYVKAINKGDVPVIQDAWSYVCDQQRHKLEDQVLSTCMSEFTTCLTSATTHREFMNLLSAVQRRVLSTFEQQCVELYTSHGAAPFIDMLSTRVCLLAKNFEEQFTAKLEMVVGGAVQQVLHELDGRLMRRQLKDIAEFRTAVDQSYNLLCDKYGVDLVDVAWFCKLEGLLWRAMTDFFGGHEAELARVAAELQQVKQLSEGLSKKHAEALERVEAEKQNAIETLKEAHACQFAQLQFEQEEVQVKLTATEQEAAKLAGELLEATTKANQQLTELDGALSAERQRCNGLEEEVTMLKDELEDVAEDGRKLQEQSRQLSEALFERDRLKGELAANKRELAEQRSSFSTMEQSLLKEAKEMQAKALQSLAVMKETRRAEQTQLKAARDDAQNKCVALELTVSQLREEVTHLLDGVEEHNKLRTQLQNLEQRHLQMTRDVAQRQRDQEAAMRDKELAAEQAVQRVRDEKRRMEQEFIVKVQHLEARVAKAEMKAEASEQEKKRQAELAEERWQRKRARTGDDGDNKSVQLGVMEAELQYLRQHRADLELQVKQLSGEVRSLQRSLDTQLDRLKLEYEHKLALAEQSISHH